MLFAQLFLNGFSLNLKVIRSLIQQLIIIIKKKNAGLLELCISKVN